MLAAFNITNFRNFETVHCNFNNRWNIFYGENGSGKTSLLEAIYYLALGRSFRSHLIRRIIKYNTDGFAIFGKVQQQNELIPVGVNRSITQGKKIKVAGEEVSSNLEITKLLPLQLLNQDSYCLFADGPKARRQFIDRGLFHVEPDFLSLWRQVERIVEQRNAAIRTNSHQNYIKTWDKELSHFGFALHQRRTQYVDAFIPITQAVLQQLLPDFSINISYFAGWDVQQDLGSVLANNLKNDLHLGYTILGPQRADLRCTVNKIPVKDALSRGQQKLFLYGLQISQGILFNKLTRRNYLYLLDDLPAELDSQKCFLLATILAQLESQVFVTGFMRSELAGLFAADSTMFHVKHGSVFLESSS